MKFADDQHLTPVGIWLKRKLIMLIKLMRPPDAGKDAGAAAPRQVANEGEGALGRQAHLGTARRGDRA